MEIWRWWQSSIEGLDLLVTFILLKVDRGRKQNVCLVVLDSSRLLPRKGFLRFRDRDRLFQQNHHCSKSRAHRSSSKLAWVCWRSSWTCSSYLSWHFLASPLTLWALCWLSFETQWSFRFPRWSLLHLRPICRNLRYPHAVFQGHLRVPCFRVDSWSKLCSVNPLWLCLRLSPNLIQVPCITCLMVVLQCPKEPFRTWPSSRVVTLEERVFLPSEEVGSWISLLLHSWSSS